MYDISQPDFFLVKYETISRNIVSNLVASCYMPIIGGEGDYYFIMTLKESFFAMSS